MIPFSKTFLKRGLFLGFICTMMLRTGFGQGINFLEGGFYSVADAAKRANKTLFVEVYLTGCPHCAALAPILEDKKVGDYFNTHFVSYKVEANSVDSKLLQQQKGITYVEFPLFFFFDPNSGQLIHQAAPSEKPNRAEAIEEVIKHGKDAADPSQRTSAYAGRFAKGDRDLGFLINYGKYAKATKDLDKLWLINQEMGKLIVLPSDLQSPVCFYIIQRLINDFSNPIAAYFFNNLPKYRAKFPAKDIKEAGESILYYTMYGKRANEITASEIVEVRKAFIKLGITPEIAGSRTILKELEAYFRAKATVKATARLNEYRRSAPMVITDYAYLVRYFNEKATDNSYIPSLLTWVSDGLKLAKPTERNSKEVAELYVEQSKALMRIGKKEEAKKAAQIALTTAKAAKIEVKPYIDELARINK
jgi:hypothetical protein